MTLYARVKQSTPGRHTVTRSGPYGRNGQWAAVQITLPDGLHSATVDCGPAGVFPVAALSAAECRLAAERLAIRMGRAAIHLAIACTISAAGLLAAADPSKADPVPLPRPRPIAAAAHALPLATVTIDGRSWFCATGADCAAMVAAMGCRPVTRPDNAGRLWLACDRARHDVAMARHSA